MTGIIILVILEKSIILSLDINVNNRHVIRPYKFRGTDKLFRPNV
jgi:hypothetical protein